MNYWSFITEWFDLPILDWIAEHLWCPFLDAVMPAITVLGDAGIFWIILTLVLLCIPKCRKMGLSMGVSLLIGALLCNVIMKPMFGRIRPYDYVKDMDITIKLLVDALHDFSFPSGHTLASFGAATALFLHHKKWGIAALTLASLIAFSRLYLYVHYPTDVLAGLVLGVAIGYVSTVLVKLGCSRYQVRKQAKQESRQVV